MLETEYRLSNLSGKLLDLDVSPDGGIVGMVDNPDRRMLLLNEAESELPEFVQFPIVRYVNDDCVLVLDSRTEKKRKANAWFFDRDGKIMLSFSAGDGIADAVALESKIAITYFDEGVFSGISPSEQGVVVFDLTGKIVLEYQKKFAAEAVDIIDCYCACKSEKSKLLFSPHTGFPVVELDLNTYKQRVFSLPKKLHGASALSALADKVYFHSPYQNKGEIFAWQFGGEQVTSCGFFGKRMRGIANGQFLTHDDYSYSIISPL